MRLAGRERLEVHVQARARRTELRALVRGQPVERMHVQRGRERGPRSPASPRSVQQSPGCVGGVWVSGPAPEGVRQRRLMSPEPGSHWWDHGPSGPERVELEGPGFAARRDRTHRRPWSPRHAARSLLRGVSMRSRLPLSISSSAQAMTRGPRMKAARPPCPPSARADFQPRQVFAVRDSVGRWSRTAGSAHLGGAGGS